jgi:hypothetical protein
MRNKKIRLLFFPIVILLWIIGWTMLWADTRKEQKTKVKTATEDEFITIIPMIPEEQEQYEA